MNNNSLINNIYINIFLYVENSFLKGNGLKKLLEKFGGQKPDWVPPPPTKYTISLVPIKQMHLAAKTVVLGVSVMAVGACGRDEEAVRRHWCVAQSFITISFTGFKINTCHVLRSEVRVEGRKSSLLSSLQCNWNWGTERLWMGGWRGTDADRRAESRISGSLMGQGCEPTQRRRLGLMWTEPS